MNKVILMGRLTRDPEIRYSQGERSTAVARYSLAVNRTFKRDGDPDADFINCVAFGRQAEFAEKYFHKGIRIVITGRIQTAKPQVIATAVILQPIIIMAAVISSPEDLCQVRHHRMVL